MWLCFISFVEQSPSRTMKSLVQNINSAFKAILGIFQFSVFLHRTVRELILMRKQMRLHFKRLNAVFSIDLYYYCVNAVTTQITFVNVCSAGWASPQRHRNAHCLPLPQQISHLISGKKNKLGHKRLPG